MEAPDGWWTLMGLQEASNDGDDALICGDDLLGLEARPLIVAPDLKQRVRLHRTP